MTERSVDFSADLSVIAFAIAWLLAGRHARTNDSAAGRLSNACYTFGALGMVVHVLLAYAIAHHWSHQAALDHTAQQTQSVVGFAFPSGLYANFAFLVIYVADAAWRWRCGHPSLRSPVWLRRSVDGFLLGMVLMASVVFEAGAIRYVMLAVVAVMLTLQWVQRPPGRVP